MRRSDEHARRTRERIVTAAVARSSTDGLSGLTVGLMAADVGMSKAGVVGPFGSREQLQLAALERAAQLFTEAVVRPSDGVPAGLARLRAVTASWCTYLRDGPFPNGCFVTAAACELDGRPGPLRDAVADTVRRWRAFLRAQVTAAQAAGELRADVAADDVVALLNGVAMSANQEIQLLGDRRAAARAARLMRRYLDDLAAGLS